MKDKKLDKINVDPISDLEKIQLRKRIFQSVSTFKSRRKRNRYIAGMVASIVLLIGGVFYLNKISTESIEDFVKSSRIIPENNTDEVVLILGEGENVDIASGDPTITYSETGKEIKIGNSNSIQQKVSKGQKVVYNTLLVPYGKRSKIALSDGSIIWLNSGSRLTYPVVFQASDRKVYLEGEAIFEVAHDAQRPFVVLSEGQEIEVLGTVFNVSCYGDENVVKTVLKSGSIQINYLHPNSGTAQKTLKITPGTLAVYDKQNRNMESKTVDVDQYFSWREGMLIFKNDNLRFIMKKLSRYYNMEISIDDPDLANETFSGYLDLKEEIERVLETFKGTTDLNYSRIDKTKISINKKSQMDMK